MLTAIFLGAGGELIPDLYVEAARPAVFVGGIVLVISAIAALWLPAGRALEPDASGQRVRTSAAVGTSTRSGRV